MAFLHRRRFRNLELRPFLSTLQLPLQLEFPELDDLIRMRLGLDFLDSLWATEYSLHDSILINEERSSNYS